MDQIPTFQSLSKLATMRSQSTKKEHQGFTVNK